MEGALVARAVSWLPGDWTGQQNKELKDLGITAKEWARRKGMGEEAVTVAHAFAFDAEFQMAQLLKASKRAKGADKGGRKKFDGTRKEPSNSPPTLEEMGITKKESSAAQKLASLPNVATFRAPARLSGGRMFAVSEQALLAPPTVGPSQPPLSHPGRPA